MDSEHCSQSIPPVQSGGTISCPGLWFFVGLTQEKLISTCDREKHPGQTFNVPVFSKRKCCLVFIKHSHG